MKTKILFLAANPTGTGQLAIDKECRQLTANIRAGEGRDSLELVICLAVTPNDLLQYFHQHQPQVVHLSGHGTRSGEIVLQGKNGKSKAVSVSALKLLFTALKDNIRLVVFNSCFSRVQAEAITEVVDCCVGMNKAIRDDAAIAFAAAFYQAIAFRKSVKVAFDCGIVAQGLEGIPGRGIPELFCRAGVNPDKVFLLKSKNDGPRRQTEDVPETSRKRSSLPRMVAKFHEANGELCRNTRGRCPEYGMDLWIEGAPLETKKAAFEILDIRVWDRKWSIPRQRAAKSVREFLTDDVSLYGDVEIWVRGLGNGVGSWVGQSTLYEALRRYYDRRATTKEIRSALKQIRDN